QGNEICFHPHPNWINLHLTYEDCCSQDALHGADCFGPLGGFYTWSFCCQAPPRDCDWHEILSVVAASEQVGPETLQRLADYPVLLREFCCLVPGDEDHPCWHLYGLEPNARLPGPFIQCCFPVLRRLLSSEAPDWMRLELDREFAVLRRRWSGQELKDFQTSAEAKSGRPCLLSVRRGAEILHHGLDQCCPRDLEGNDCSYIHSVAESLFILGSLKSLPDMDLLVSPGNQDRIQATVPVFTRHRTRERSGYGGYVLLPMEWQLSPGQARKQTVAATRVAGFFRPERRRVTGRQAAKEPWSQCLQSYDCQTPLSFKNFMNTPRGRLVLASQFVENVDARFVGMANPVEEEVWDFLVKNNLTEQRVNQLEEAQWSYAINVDGTGSGDRIYWQMLMRKVVLVQESAWVSWLLGPVPPVPSDPSDGAEAPAALRPWEHYLPLRMDLADLSQRLRWLDAHPEEAERIAETAARWAREFLSYDWILYYLDCAVRRYAEFHFDPATLLDVQNASRLEEDLKDRESWICRFVALLPLEEDRPGHNCITTGPFPMDFLLSALLAAEKTLGYRVVNLIEGSDRMTGESTPNPEWLLDPWAPEKGAWIPGN
ncbi:unnamed protein product, partial [Cladocopium goreaui]